MSNSQKLTLVLLLLVFTAALGVRLYRITEPWSAFHPTRQYRSALIARALLYEVPGKATVRERQTANASKPALLEPPVMEYLAAAAWWAFDDESLVYPRIITVLLWLLGGVFFWRVCLRVLNHHGALFATCLFLFLPFGVVASRSFQPDPLMLTLMVASILTILRYRQAESWKRLALATAVFSMAILVKPVCLMPILLVFLSTHGRGAETIRAVFRRETIVFGAVGLIPVLSYYASGMVGRELLEGQWAGFFMPRLYTRGFFWQEWAGQLDRVFGLGILLMAGVGVLLLRDNTLKRLVLGLSLGYLLYGLLFTHHIHTHDYYHLLAIPLFALLSGSLVATVSGWCEPRAPVFRVALHTGLTLYILYLAVGSIQLTGRYGEGSKIALYERMGDQVGHSTRTLFLTEAYGTPLRYFGRLAGSRWPSRGDILHARKAGRAISGGKERLKGLMSGQDYEYFIVTALSDFRKQPDLVETLDEYPVVAGSDQHRIYDLTGEKPSN